MRQKPIDNWVQGDIGEQTTDNPNRPEDMTNIPRCYLTRVPKPKGWKTRPTQSTPPRLMEESFWVALGLSTANERLIPKFLITSEVLHARMYICNFYHHWALFIFLLLIWRLCSVSYKIFLIYNILALLINLCIWNDSRPDCSHMKVVY